MGSFIGYKLLPQAKGQRDGKMAYVSACLVQQRYLNDWPPESHSPHISLAGGDSNIKNTAIYAKHIIDFMIPEQIFCNPWLDPANLIQRLS